MPKHGALKTEQLDVAGVVGGIKHSRLHSSGFTWKKACARALKKQLYRAEQLARTNITYQIKYPNECRDITPGKCHPEAEKRILADHEKILQNSMVPTVERPKRLSKVG